MKTGLCSSLTGRLGVQILEQDYQSFRISEFGTVFRNSKYKQQRGNTKKKIKK
jgi:hypothetical protein